jgi:hypothetical protein
LSSLNINQRIGVLSREMAAGESVIDQPDHHQTLRNTIFFVETFLAGFFQNIFSR